MSSGACYAVDSPVSVTSARDAIATSVIRSQTKICDRRVVVRAPKSENARLIVPSSSQLRAIFASRLGVGYLRGSSMLQPTLPRRFSAVGPSLSLNVARLCAAAYHYRASWKMIPTVCRIPERTRLTPWRKFTR
jgi:hypothetical protein